MQTLQDHFLIATPKMPDPRFQEQLIYICAHSPEEGAMGLVVNKPIDEITLEDIFRNSNIALPTEPLPPVYLGGPVEMEAGFFLFSSEYHPQQHIDISPLVRLSRDPEILHSISSGQGPKDFIFLLGYAGWAPGQLENELRVDGWLTLPASYEDIFHTSDDLKWKNAAKRFGIDISLFGDIVGSA